MEIIHISIHTEYILNPLTFWVRWLSSWSYFKISTNPRFMFNTYFPSLRYSIITASYSLLCVLILCMCMCNGSLMKDNLQESIFSFYRVGYVALAQVFRFGAHTLTQWTTSPACELYFFNFLWAANLLNTLLLLQLMEEMLLENLRDDGITGMLLVSWLSDFLLYLDRHNGWLKNTANASFQSFIFLIVWQQWVVAFIRQEEITTSCTLYTTVPVQVLGIWISTRSVIPVRASASRDLCTHMSHSIWISI